MAPSLVAMLLGLQSAFSATTNGPVAVPLRESAGAPVFTRAEMEADLEHLTVRLKRAWAYAEDKHAWLGVDIDSLHAAARRALLQRSGLCSLTGAVRDGVFFDVETDFGFGQRWRRGHELADGVENRFELGIVFLLQVRKFASQFAVAEEHFPQAYERAHDGDIDLHGPPAAHDAGKHGDTLFRERHRRGPAELAECRYHSL